MSRSDGFRPLRDGNDSLAVDVPSAFADRVDDLVRLALGDRAAVDAAVRARADQVRTRLAGVLKPGRTPRERIDALMDTYMHGALQVLADAAAGDRMAFAEAEIIASSVAAAMDRAAEAAANGETDVVAAAMASAEALLDLDLAALYDLLL